MRLHVDMYPPRERWLTPIAILGPTSSVGLPPGKYDLAYRISILPLVDDCVSVCLPVMQSRFIGLSVCGSRSQAKDHSERTVRRCARPA